MKMKPALRPSFFVLAAAAAIAAAAEPPPRAALPDLPENWTFFVCTNASAVSEADFRDGALMPLLREEALAPLLAGPDRDAPWLAEAADYAERELLLAWEGPGWLASPPNPHWGRAYDFTVREGSKDPFLTWMSVVGQKKWHWDDHARGQLAELEAALAARPADEAAFPRLLAAHARQFVDPSPEHARALCAAAVRWAESHAARPDRSEAVLRVLVQFVDVEEPAFVAALLGSSADPWIGLVAAGNAAFSRHGRAPSEEERERDVTDAEAAWRRAWQLHPEFPQAAEGLMRAAAHRRDRAGVGAWFRAGAAARYDSPSLHDRHVAFLRPAWGGALEALRRHADECFAASDPGCFPDAAARERARSMLPYGGVLALLAALDASGESPETFFRQPGFGYFVDAALAPMLGENPALGPSGATDGVRYETGWFLAAVHWVLGDEEGAFRVYETVRGVPAVYCRRLEESFPGAFGVIVHLSGLTGPNADLVRSLRRRFLDGDADGFLAQSEEALASRPDLVRSEKALLGLLGVRAFLATGFRRGGTYRVPVAPHREFTGWFDYGVGWQPEVDDDGGYVWYTGKTETGVLEFGTPLPVPLEIGTAFEPDPATNVQFAVRLFPSDERCSKHSGPAPALSARLENGTLRLRLGPAGDRYLDWGVDENTPVSETNVLLSAVLHAAGAETKSRAESAEAKSHAESAESAEAALPGGGSGEAEPPPVESRAKSAERIPLRIVFLPDRVRCYLGADPSPALDVSTAAFAPSAFPDGAKLVFYGRRCRFFGFSFRNPLATRSPDAEETHAESAESAKPESRAESAKPESRAESAEPQSRAESAED